MLKNSTLTAGTEPFTSLIEIEADCWKRFGDGQMSSRHPFHQPVVANAGAAGVEMRTVVLRRVDAIHRVLCFHTDIRSRKWQCLREQSPMISWLFYTPEDRIQVRVQGTAMLHHLDSLAREAWDSSPLHCRRIYMGDDQPGAPSASMTHGLPDELLERVPTEPETEKGWKKFGLVLCTVEKMDWLKLSSRGHRRAEFRYLSGGGTSAVWLVP